MADREGQRLGNYRLGRLLGQGHLTEVYLGEHVYQQTQVALKVLETELSSYEVAQFLIQAQAVAQLRHPHIVEITDFGVEDGLPFLVMTYAPHGTLRQRHPRGTPLPLATIVSYVEQIAAALHLIHEHKLIHRDVKPHNMLIGPENQIWLSDFDIAVVSQNMGYRREKAQFFEGTVPYAAPEQLRGQPRLASDQYALGVVVYEWLSGDWPFHGSLSEMTLQHQITPPPSLRERNPAIPAAVEQVVMRALVKDPHERFESILEFSRAFERASRLEKQGTAPLSLHQFKSPFPRLSPPPSAVGEEAEPATPEHTTPLVTYRGHTAQVMRLAWSPTGLAIASASLDETIQIWKPSGEVLLKHHGLSLEAPILTWSPDGRYLASTEGLLSEMVQVWHATTGQPAFSEALAYEGHTERVDVLAWSPNGRYIASGGEDHTVQIWEAASKRRLFTYRGHTLSVTALAWSPDSRQLASACEDHAVHVWDAQVGNNIRIYYRHLDKINALAWSPDGLHIASASDDQTVHVWEAAQPQSIGQPREVVIFQNHQGAVTSLAWSPSGEQIASCSTDETVQLWDTSNGQLSYLYHGHSDWVSSVSWAPDGSRLASSSWDKTAQVWRVE